MEIPACVTKGLTKAFGKSAPKLADDAGVWAKAKNAFKKVDKDANGAEITRYSKARIGTAAGASLFTIGCMLPSDSTQAQDSTQSYSQYPTQTQGYNQGYAQGY